MQGEASPLQLARLYFSRGTEFFLEEQWRVCQARLHRPDGVPVTKKALFCWKERVGRAPQSDGWSGPFPLQAAQGAGTEPGKGFLMRRYNASLLSIVAGHN